KRSPRSSESQSLATPRRRPPRKKHLLLRPVHCLQPGPLLQLPETRHPLRPPPCRGRYQKVGHLSKLFFCAVRSKQGCDFRQSEIMFRKPKVTMHRVACGWLETRICSSFEQYPARFGISAISRIKQRRYGCFIDLVQISDGSYCETQRSVI